MIPPSFTPFSDDGMSIITAIFLFFSSIICCMFATWVYDKNKKQDFLIDDHAEKIHTMGIKLTEISGDTKTTREILQRMDSSISDLGRANRDLTTSILSFVVDDKKKDGAH